MTATNDVYLRPDAGDGQNDVRLRQDAADSAAVTYTYVGSGGIVFSGVAILEITKTYLPAGGFVFAGDAATEYSPAQIQPVESPPRIGGGVGVLYKPRPAEIQAVSWEYQGSGGIRIGGAAKTEFVDFWIQYDNDLLLLILADAA